MKNNHTINKLMATLLFVGAFGAWGKGNLDLKTEAFKVTEEVAKDGTKSTKMVPAVKVAPGEEVIFFITYRNIGKQAATDVVIVNPIPKNMIYRSMQADKTTIQEDVSIDGGKKFGKLEALKVADKSSQERTAMPQDVTHVRWKFASAVQPKEEGKVQFKALLK